MAALNQALRDALTAGLKKGLNMQEIAEESGFSYNALRKQARRLGISSNPGRPPREEEWKPKTTPQYDAWLKSKEGAARTLQDMSA